MDDENSVVEPFDFDTMDYSTVGSDDPTTLEGGDTGDDGQGTEPDNSFEPTSLDPNGTEEPDDDSDNDPEGGSDPDDAGDNQPDNNGDDGGSDDNDTQTELSGIELYLSQFDIEGGMLNVGDEVRHFDDLTAEQQMKVLSQLNQPSNEGPQMSATDTQILQQAQANGMDLQSYIDAQVQYQAQSIAEWNSVRDLNIEEMTDDQIARAMILAEEEEEISTDELEQRLSDAQALKSYDSLVKATRHRMIADRDAMRDQAAREEQMRMQQDLNDYRMNVIDAVAPIDTMYDVVIDDQIKNSVLDNVLSIDEEGRGIFQAELMSDPAKLFKAAFLYYNAEGLLNGRDRYWKTEISKARKAWESQRPTQTKNNNPTSSKQSFTGTQNNNKPVNNKQTEEDKMDFDLDFFSLND